MSLVYTAVRVKDHKKSLAFYKSMGLKVIGRRSWVPGEKIVMLLSKDTGQRLNLMWFSKDCMWYTPWKNDGVELDHLMFEVKDAKKTYQKLVAYGAKVATELWEGKDRTMGFIKDPNGIWIGIASKNKK
jgi:catechol 2,3-dioxygenase-like lactoylglutathione lyase family enzyme